MRLKIDTTHLDDDAEAWWRSLSPGIRAVYVQALWECEEASKPGAQDADAQEPQPDALVPR